MPRSICLCGVCICARYILVCLQFGKLGWKLTSIHQSEFSFFILLLTGAGQIWKPPLASRIFEKMDGGYKCVRWKLTRISATKLSQNSSVYLTMQQWHDQEIKWRDNKKDLCKWFPFSPSKQTKQKLCEYLNIHYKLDCIVVSLCTSTYMYTAINASNAFAMVFRNGCIEWKDLALIRLYTYEEYFYWWMMIPTGDWAIELYTFIITLSCPSVSIFTAYIHRLDYALRHHIHCTYYHYDISTMRVRFTCHIA